jgi:hypothetical protein
MADKLVPSLDDGGAVRRFRDMADGTWAEVVSTSAPAPAAGTGGYPTGATPVHASASGAAAIVAATLPAAVGKTTYISKLVVTGGGATAAQVTGVTLSGIVGGSAVYVLGVPAGVAFAVTPLVLDFNPPVPASAINTAIAVTANSFGAGNLNANVEAFGFQL